MLFWCHIHFPGSMDIHRYISCDVRLLRYPQCCIILGTYLWRIKANLMWNVNDINALMEIEKDNLYYVHSHNMLLVSLYVHICIFYYMRNPPTILFVHIV